MMTRHPPFQAATPIDQHYKMIGCGYQEAFWKAHRNALKDPNFFSEDFKFLFESMVAYDPMDRLSIAEIKESEWYNGPVPSHECYMQQMSNRRDALTKFGSIRSDLLGTKATT